MRHPTFALIALAFAGGLLLRCEVGSWAIAEPPDDTTDGGDKVCDCPEPPAPPEPVVLDVECKQLGWDSAGSLRTYADVFDDRISVASVAGVYLCERECWDNDGEAIECPDRCFSGHDCVGSQQGYRPRTDWECLPTTSYILNARNIVARCSSSFPGSSGSGYRRMKVVLR